MGEKVSNEVAGKIEYIIRNYPAEAVDRIAAIIDGKDAFIKKLAQIGSDQEKELQWARGVLSRYEMRLQAQANLIEEYKAEDIARGQGRTATFVELASCHKHILTERYEG